MSSTNGKSEAVRPRIPKKRVLTAAEMRSKASYRAMERLLESTIENEEQLWSIARVMSGEEFLAASEERCLAGLCGNALCSNVMPEYESKGNFQIDATEKKVYAAVEGPGYCGVDCAAASKAFAHRLGSGGQAMHRFERLMEQLRKKKRKQRLSEQQSTQASKNEENSTMEETTPPPSDAPSNAQPVRPKGVLKKKPDLAAGTTKVPIMAAQVKEREQPIDVGAEPPKPPSARKTHAIEGYVPKAALKQHRKEQKEGRKVRFSDADEYSDDKKAVGVAAVAAAAVGSAHEGCGISPSGYGWEDQPEEDALENRQNQEAAQEVQVSHLPGQPAVFVLDVEDADGPLEGAEHALSSKFGRLRVANEQELQEAGLPVPTMNISSQEQSSSNEENSSLVAAPATTTTSATIATATATATAPTTEPSVDEILTQRLRQGASKYFPQLAATLPPELAQTLEDSASEAGSSGAESGEEWILSDTDSEDEDDENSGFDNGNASNGRFAARPTLFGQLVTNLDAWVTDFTLELLQTGPEDTSSSSSSSFSSLSASVPEIETALSRFIAFALPPVMEKLAISMPKGEVERNLMELIKTFQLANALPAFTTLQWQLVVMTFLKALSIERVPGLRPAFETREGVHRVNQVLTANTFTIEEFVAVLEILLESG